MMALSQWAYEQNENQQRRFYALIGPRACDHGGFFETLEAFLRQPLLPFSPARSELIFNLDPNLYMILYGSPTRWLEVDEAGEETQKVVHAYLLRCEQRVLSSQRAVKKKQSAPHVVNNSIKKVQRKARQRPRKARQRPRKQRPPLVKKRMSRERRVWTPKEDRLLKELVHLHGTKRWSKMSQVFNQQTPHSRPRKGKSLRERYMHYLDPSLNLGPWTKEEDQRLIRLVQAWGHQWSKISHRFQGRSDQACKNHANVLMRKTI